MAIEAGQQLLHYRLIEKIGEGGMGVVWKAVDTELDREVAIKILPDTLSRDAERRARFEREAKVLASLNHPNIGHIYGLAEADGIQALVLELVEGPTLADRITQGAIAIDETLLLARQITEALEAAHERGIVHRDLKPANVKVRPDGTVKVLDFGLAKELTPVETAGQRGVSPTQSPTVTSAGTVAGVILGTAAYMSPEQARGEPVDRRADIWAFGIVLFEAMTGKPLFRGKTATDSIGAILHREPDWSALPPETPLLVRLLLRRCLEKDIHRRLRDIGDARIDLETAIADPTAGDSLRPHPPPQRRRLWTALSVGALLAAAALGFVIGRGAREPRATVSDPPTIRFSIDLAAQGLMLDSTASNLALDPSGTVLAFEAGSENGRSIYVRALAGSSEARPLAGTEGGHRPFFSPDGRWLGFIRDGQLMKVPSTGGPALTICECELWAGWSDPAWLDDGTIVFIAPAPRAGTALQRVDAAGGKPETLAVPDFSESVPNREKPIWGFDSPVPVPGRSYVLASIYYGVTIEGFDVVTVSLDDGSVRRILANATEPRYLPPDRLVFSRESSLYAAPFDVRRGVVTGEPEPVLDGVLVNEWGDSAQYAVAENGTLAYVPGRRRGPGRRLVHVDATGRREPLREDALLLTPRVSPDGTKLLFATLRRKLELWVLDLERGSPTLISDLAPSYSLAWMPDGDEVIYHREGSAGTPNQIIRQAVYGDDAGQPIALGGSDGFEFPSSVSPDGKFLLLTRSDPSLRQGDDIVLFRLEEGGSVEPLVATSARERAAVFSPGGDSYAYVSDESGRSEVYVRQFPESGRPWQVSTDGGHSPRWSHSGDQLFFANRGALFRSHLQTRNGFQAGRPEKLLDLEGIPMTWAYDVFPDDSFVMTEPAPWENETPRIEVVVHWRPE